MILFSAAFPLFLFLGCASTSGIQSEKTSDGFIKSVDEVTGFVSYVHKDLKFDYYIYNLHNSFTGEHENFSIKIRNGFIVADCDYQNKNWLFIESFILYSDDLRLQKSVKRSDSVNHTSGFSVGSAYFKGNVSVSEHGSCILSDDDVELLEKICNSDDVKVCFVGSKGRTDVFKVDKDIKNAIIATIIKWREIAE